MSQTLDQILDLDLPVPGVPATIAPAAPTPVVGVPAVMPPLTPTPDVSANANNTPTQDATDARTNVRLLIAQGAAALGELLVVAKDTKSPRAYEVASAMLKTMSELNQDLMRVHEQEQVLTQEDTPASVHIEQAVFVGSTADLGELVKQKRAERNANTNNIEAKTITILPASTSNTEVLS